MQKQDNKEDIFDNIYHNRGKENFDQFKDLLKEDQELKDDFSDYLHVNEFARKNFRTQFDKKFKSDIEEQANLHRRKRNIWRYSVAASILFLVLPTSFLVYNHITFWDRLHNQYMINIQETTLLGKQEDSYTQNQKLLNKAFKLIEENQVELAIPFLKQVKFISTQTYDDYFVARYTLATTYIKLKQKQQALKIIDELIARKENHHLKTKAEQLKNDLLKYPSLFF